MECLSGSSRRRLSRGIPSGIPDARAADTNDLKEAKALLDNLTEPAIAAEG